MDSIRCPASPGEIKPAITQNVNGMRQILGFAQSLKDGDSARLMLLTGTRHDGMVRRTFASP
jgi:hypothetical protein